MPEPVPFDPVRYGSDVYTDYAIEFIQVCAGNRTPLFVFIADHLPLQTPEDLIQKYLPVYTNGWNSVRAQRYRKQLELAGGLAAFSARRSCADWENLFPTEPG